VLTGRPDEFIGPKDDHHGPDWHSGRVTSQPTPAGRPDPEVRTHEEKRQQGKKSSYHPFEPSRHRNDNYAQFSVGKGGDL